MRCSLLKITETDVQSVPWLELRTLLLRLRATRDNAGMHGDARGNTPKARHYTQGWPRRGEAAEAWPRA